MRPIKFRAWDKVNKTWSPNISMVFNLSRNWASILDDDELELMQFTGLLDKNGKEIWEGSILKSTWRKNPFRIIFYDSAFRGIHGQNEPTEDFPGFVFTKFEVADSEVIGDIHQNPDLLK
jgi:uncharacterized phage protein (TIGR01671 family)